MAYTGWDYYIYIYIYSSLRYWYPLRVMFMISSICIQNRCGLILFQHATCQILQISVNVTYFSLAMCSSIYGQFLSQVCISISPLFLHYSDVTCVSTETEMSSFWRNFHHWLHRKLSKWQLSVQSVIKISSKWQHFRFSVNPKSLISQRFIQWLVQIINKETIKDPLHCTCVRRIEWWPTNYPHKWLILRKFHVLTSSQWWDRWSKLKLTSSVSLTTVILVSAERTIRHETHGLTL